MVRCDKCTAKLATTSTTGAGARGDAERAGWRVSYLAGGAHPTKRSSDPNKRDECPACRTDLPAPPPDLFTEGKP